MLKTRKTFDKGLRPSWRWMRVQAEPDKAVEDCWQWSSTPLLEKF